MNTGTQVMREERICSNCQTAVPKAMLRCRECGTRLPPVSTSQPSSSQTSGTSGSFSIDDLLDSAETVDTPEQETAYVGRDGKIRKPCPKCGRRVKAPIVAAGKTVQCPFCTVPVSLPSRDQLQRSSSDSSATSNVAPSVFNRSAEVNTHVPAADSRKEAPSNDSSSSSGSHSLGMIGEDGRIRTNCGNCQRRVKAPSSLAGMEVRCPFCGDQVLIPAIAAQSAANSSAKSGVDEVTSRLRGQLTESIDVALAKPLRYEELETPANPQNKKQVKAWRNAIFKSLESDANRKDVEIAREALKNVSESGDQKLGQEIAQQLTKFDDRLRAPVLLTLGKLRIDEAFEPIMRALASPNIDEVRAAIQALGEFASSSIVRPLLIVQAIHSSESVRVKVAIGKTGQAGARELMGIIESNADKWMRTAATKMLNQFNSVEAIEVLERVLERDDVDMRREAAEALVNISDRGIIRPLVAMLQDEDPRIRTLAASGLIKTADKRAIAPLIIALNDDFFEVRANAIQALGEHGDETAAPKLMQFLGEGHLETQILSAEALGKLGRTEAVPHLIALFEEHHRQADSEKLNQKIVDALRRIRDTRATLPLVDALDTPSSRLRRRIVEALGVIGDPSARVALQNVLSQDTNEDVRAAAAKALGVLGDPAAVPALREALTETADVRVKALIALGQFNDPSVRNAVREMLADPVPQVRYQAINVLKDLADPETIPDLEPLVLDQDGLVKRGALTALESLGDKRSESEIAKSVKKRQRTKSQRNLLVDLIPTSMVGTFAAIPGGLPTIVGGLALVIALGFGLSQMGGMSMPGIGLPSLGSGKPVIQGYVTGVSVSEDGSLIFVSRSRGLTELWNSQTGKRVDTTTDLPKSAEVLINKSLSTAAVAGPREMHFIDVTDSGFGDVLAVPSEGGVIGIASNMDHSIFATLGLDGVVRRWDMKTRASDAAIAVKNILGIGINSDGSIIAGLSRRDLTMFDAKTGEVVAQVKIPDLAMSEAGASMAFSPDDSILAVGTTLGKVFTIDVKKARLLGELSNVPYFTRVGFSKDGTLFTFNTKLLKFSDPSKNEPVEVGSDFEIASTIAFSPAGVFASGKDDEKPIYVTEVSKGKPGVFEAN